MTLGSMRLVCGLGLALACISQAAISAPPTQASPQTLYRGATLVDVRTGVETRGVSILVEGERIGRIAPDGEIAATPGVHLVDVHGLFAIPGLVNAHVHLATPPDRALAEAFDRSAIWPAQRVWGNSRGRTSPMPPSWPARPSSATPAPTT
jgi:hypothetical protein